MFKLFSVDDHLIEHPRVWTDRLPKRYQEAGPHVVEEEGTEFWYHEGRRGASTGQLSASAEANRYKTKSNTEAQLSRCFADMMPGCYDPKARTADMFSNGVVASVCFPSVPRFAGTLFERFEDKKLADLCVKAYNDFVVEEWCPGGPPGLFVPMSICQLWDPAAAAEEILRCAAVGVRAISMPENPVPLQMPSYYSDYWNPIWRACEEAELVICLHIATSGEYPRPSPEGPEAASTVLLPGIGSQMSLVNLLFSPVCREFPGLKFVFSESGMGWASFVIERADLVYERYERPQNLGPVRPSEIWRRNMFLCQVEERIGLSMLDLIGAEKVVWELDYPHPDMSWPLAQEAFQEVVKIAGLSDEHIEMVTHRNAEELFRWKVAELPST